MKTFSEKLLELRRREGLSQEQLADRLGVTRQSVSKWEGGAAVPELSKIVALSEIFRVSVDYLVKDQLDEFEPPAQSAPAPTAKLEAQVEELSSYFRGYAWDSKTRILGLPLVSVRFQFSGHIRRSRDVAKGIIAIGNIAVGVVAIGLMSFGIFSLGVTAAGLLVLGVLAFGPVAFGVLALGVLAFGVTALGAWYAGGVTAIGGRIAVGIAAIGKTAVGYNAEGQNILLWGEGLSRPEVRDFLSAHCPDLWNPILEVLAFLGANIK